MADPGLIEQVYDRFGEKLGNPSVTVSVVGGTGTNYQYIVTAVGDSGETDGTVVDVSGPSSLSATSYITLNWLSVDRAKKYRVYGRSAGSIGFMVETTALFFTDYGVIVPDTTKVPPAENTTGRVDWERVDFLPGRYLQSAELNEIQSIINFHQERLGRTIFVDGDIISGCSITVDSANLKAIITSGTVFVRGRVRNVDGAEISITGVGKEVIGLKVSESYIDATDDSVLLDPAQGYRGYATSGALRRVVQLSWVKDEGDMIPVWELMNGSVVKNLTGTRYSELEKRLAVRTDDISGHVIVRGLDLSVMEHGQRRDTVVFNLGSGKAYVRGFEVEKPQSVKWEEKTALDYKSTTETVEPRQSGSYVYELDAVPVKNVVDVTGSFFKSLSSTVPSTTDENGWYLWNFPEPSIDDVVGVWDSSAKTTQYVENTDYKVVGSTLRFNPSTFSAGQGFYVEYYYFRSLTKGTRVLTQQTDTFATDGTTTNFTLTKTDVTDVDRWKISVWLEDGGGNTIKVYNRNEYSVDLGRTETSIGSAVVALNTAPASGNNLKVQYWYWEHSVEGEYVSVDSYLDGADPYGNYYYNAVIDKNAVDLRTSGAKPSKTTLIVQYEYFLAQRAYLVMDIDGNVKLVRGLSDRVSPSLPVKPQGLLTVYEILFPAFGEAKDIVFVKQKNYMRFTVWDSNVLRDRVARVEYDLALTQEELDVFSKDVTGTRKVVFVDSFVDTDKIDIPNSNLSLITYEGKLVLPYSVESRGVSVGSLTNAVSKSGYVFKDYTVQEWIKQLIWTEDGLIPLNPYGAFGLFGHVELVPDQDFWYETKTVEEIVGSIQLTIRAGQLLLGGGLAGLPTGVPRGRRIRGGLQPISDVDTVKQKVAEMLSVDPSRLTLIAQKGANEFTFILDGELVFMEAVYAPELRQIVVYFRLFGMPALDFVCEFEGVSTECTWVGQSELDSNNLGWVEKGSAGGISGSVRTGSDGWVTGKFTIPKGIPIGERKVEFIGYAGVNEVMRVESKFLGIGSILVFKQPKTRVDVTLRRFSPLAQTFIPDSDGFIESVDVWFFRVPSNDNALVSCTIREVENGVPTSVVLGKSPKTALDVLTEGLLDSTRRLLTVEPDESAGRVRFVFDVPVFVKKGKEYAITLEDSEPGFYVFGARVGSKILGDLSGVRTKGEVLDRQAHDGVALLSVNTRTWESLQDVDVMFRINRAVFTINDGVCTFNDINWGAGIGEMIVGSVVVMPENTEIDWEWSGDGGANWNKFKPVYEYMGEEWEEEGNRFELGNLVTSMKLKATLRNGSDYVSPVIKVDTVRLMGISYGTSGAYESKNIVLIGGETFGDIRMWFWVAKNGAGSIDAVKVSFDNGNTWYNVPYVRDYDAEVGWREYEYGDSVSNITSAAITTAGQFKVRIEYSGTDIYRSIIFRRLRIVTY